MPSTTYIEATFTSYADDAKDSQKIHNPGNFVYLQGGFLTSSEHKSITQFNAGKF